MAHGKSLELAAIKKPEPKHLCADCGGVWEDHWRKDGKGLLKKFVGHQRAGGGVLGKTYVKRGKR